MSEKQKQSNLSESEQVSRTAGLYTHLNDVLDAAGQIQGHVHYHLEAINQGTSSFVQRPGGRDADQIAQFIQAYGLDAHLAALERQKMDIHFAQGKMELGRYVCL